MRGDERSPRGRQRREEEHGLEVGVQLESSEKGVVQQHPPLIKKSQDFLVFRKRGDEKPLKGCHLRDEILVVVVGPQERPDFRRRVATPDHLDLRVSKVEHEFRLRLEIFSHPIGVVRRRGLRCAAYDVPEVGPLQHQRHPRRPREVVRAGEFVEVVTPHGGRDERV